MELKKLFQYRNIWMAVALMWIVFYHTNIITTSTLINGIKELGFGGVDIFLFASGLGCYFSLDKNSDIYTFIKKRFLKLMPTYWCFILFYFIYKSVIGNIPLTAIIGNIFCIQNFTGLKNDFNWYISAIWLFYFLAPYLKVLVDKVTNWQKCTIIVLLFIIISMAFWNSNILIITITRIPIFFVGMYMAKISKKEIITKNKANILIFLMLFGFLLLKASFDMVPSQMWNYGLYWYPFIFITPGLCLIISYMCKKIENYKIGRKIMNYLEIIGKNTFEIYLVHVPLYELIKLLIKKGVLSSRKLTWLISFALIIFLCIILKIITKITIGLIRKLRIIIA